jgi:predicted ATPase
MPSIAESLGIQLSRDEDPLVEVKAFLREKQLLLVLDIFVLLTAGAGLLSAVLDAAADVRVIVTSRERLNLQHETLVVLDGLTQGDDDGGDAVELFVAGARRLNRSFALDDEGRSQAARICQLLCGIPLAIELASAWVRTLSCAEILAELERDLDVLTTEAPDLEDRHHSLRATFDASWRLLSADEKTALARLGVFRSAFDPRAAASVGGASAPVLRQLVDKSLLTRAGDRLLMLDVVRAYALEKLAADSESERVARERHLTWYTGLLRDVEEDVRRADPVAIQRVADSIDDVRASWRYAGETCNPGAFLAAADALYHVYEARGWAREGAEMFTAARSSFGDLDRPQMLPRQVHLAAARLDVRRGVFLHRLGDLKAAETVLRDTVPALRELDDRSEIVFALHRLGAVRHGMGDYAEAERLHQEGWDLSRELDDRLAIGWSMTYLGNVAWSRGDFGTATHLYTAALALLREENDLNGMWVTLNNLGVIAAGRQQYDEAQRRFREGLALLDRLQNPRFKAHILHNLGSAACELGDTVNARAWLEESLAMSSRLGYQNLSGLSHVGLAQLALREDDDAAATDSLNRALRTASAAMNHPLALEALLVLAELRLRISDTSGARELAHVIATHPSSDRDIRRRTAALFEELGEEPTQLDAEQEPADLGVIISRIVSGSPPFRGTPRRTVEPVPAQTPEEL